MEPGLGLGGRILLLVAMGVVGVGVPVLVVGVGVPVAAVVAVLVVVAVLLLQVAVLLVGAHPPVVLGVGGQGGVVGVVVPAAGGTGGLFILDSFLFRMCESISCFISSPRVIFEYDDIRRDSWWQYIISFGSAFGEQSSECNF